MKIRIQGQGIRFRLNRREVAELASSGKVEASLEFPGGRRLTYGLEKVSAAEFDTTFDADDIRVRVPERTLAEWAGSDQVSIADVRELRGGRGLEVVIEKDFQCMHKGDEAKDPEAYPNPLAAQAAS